MAVRALAAAATCLVFSTASHAASAPPSRAFFACVYQLNDPNRTCVPVDIKGINRNADLQHSPASLNKMMTSHLVLRHMKEQGKTLDDPFTTVNDDDLQEGKYGERDGALVTGGWTLRGNPGSPLYRYDPSHVYTYREVVHAMAVYSANDFACAAARAIAPDGKQATFARMMTEEARRIGMAATTFKTASGMPATGQVSTAADMALLSYKLVDIYGVETFNSLFGQSSAVIAGFNIPGHLRLIKDKDLGVAGCKTGTDAMGLNVACVVEQQKAGYGVAFSSMGSPVGPRGNRGLHRDNYAKLILSKVFGFLSGKPEVEVEAAAPSIEAKPAKAATAKPAKKAKKQPAKIKKSAPKPRR